MTLTVLSWFWRQPRSRISYQAHHVNIWADMVRRNLSMPHRLAVVTDIPEGIDRSIEIIPPPRDFEDATIPTWGPQRPQCLRRLAMFRSDAGKTFGDRFVCMDLDCIVLGPLDPLFEEDAEFRIFRGTAPGRPYNGSMMMIRAGARPQVYDRFNAAEAAIAGRKFVGSDQAWISHVLGPDERTWGAEDGVRWLDRATREPLPDDTKLVFFPGNFKPWDCLGEEWAGNRYRRDAHGRALILGYADTIWAEISAALETGKFDAVISSPEAAEHWPGTILAIADDDAHAERLARMHGYDDFVFCGRSKVA